MATQQGGVKILWVRSTVDFASTAANVITDSSGITVTGAMPGDPVILGSDTAPPAQGSFYAHVTAADTVKVRFVNNSAGAIDPASQVFNIGVIKLNDLP
jgi:hypothetical protein